MGEEAMTEASERALSFHVSYCLAISPRFLAFLRVLRARSPSNPITAGGGGPGDFARPARYLRPALIVFADAALKSSDYPNLWLTVLLPAFLIHFFDLLKASLFFRIQLRLKPFIAQQRPTGSDHFVDDSSRQSYLSRRSIALPRRRKSKTD